MKLKIPAMSCSHCVKAITQAVTQADSNAKVDIDLTTKIAQINSALDQKALLALLDDVGYDEVEVIEA